MPGRYDPKTYEGNLNFGKSGAFGYQPPPQHQPDMLDNILGIGSAIAPIAGTAIGAGVGSVVPGLGTALGAGLGGAAGAGLGVLGQGLKGMHDQPDQAAQQQYLNEQNERQARSQAAMSLLSRYA